MAIGMDPSGQEFVPESLSRNFEPATYIGELIEILDSLPIDIVQAIVRALADVYERGGAVYLFGNGGSAALASHMACDLGKGSAINGQRRFRVLSLTDNSSLITAWANDSNYEDVFAEQLRPFLMPGDVCFAISGSGNSPNVLRALALSCELGGFNIGITGFAGGKMKELCDLCLVVPSASMQQIEDAHVVIAHAVFLALRERLHSAGTVAASSLHSERNNRLRL